MLVAVRAEDGDVKSRAFLDWDLGDERLAVRRHLWDRERKDSVLCATERERGGTISSAA